MILAVFLPLPALRKLTATTATTATKNDGGVAVVAVVADKIKEDDGLYVGLIGPMCNEGETRRLMLRWFLSTFFS